MVVLTLALGIGASTTFFSVLDGVLLRPLPFPDADRLVQVWETEPGGWGSASAPNVRAWRDEGGVFEGLAPYLRSVRTVRSEGVPEPLDVVEAGADLFSLLGVAPRLGRTFVPGEDRLDAPRVAVLSESFWQRHLGADPAAVGKTLNLDGEIFTVAGVMPRGFRFPLETSEPDLWIPLQLPPHLATAWSQRFLNVVGRLAPGVSRSAAEERLNALMETLGEAYPEIQGDRGVWVRDLHEQVVEGVRPRVQLLFAAVSLLFLVACLNVANLSLVRSWRRAGATALLSALGATRGRLIRRSLTESTVLSLLGGGAGLLVAIWALDALPASAAGSLPRFGELGIDVRDFLFLLFAVALSALGFGLLPALGGSKVNVQQTLVDFGTRGSSSRTRHPMRLGLATTQVAVSCLLLFGTGLLLKSLLNLQGEDHGMTPDNVLTARLSLPTGEYPGSSAVHFHQQVLEKLNARSGVEAAGVITRLPIGDRGWDGRVGVEGMEETDVASLPYSLWNVVSPRLFEALGTSIVGGRPFDPRVPDAEPVILINEAFATRFFQGQDPVGKRVLTPDAESLFLDFRNRWYTVLGVVGNIRQASLGRPAQPEIYFDLRQVEKPRRLVNMTLVVKTRGSPDRMTQSLKEAVAEVNANQALSDIRSMEAILSESTAQMRMIAWSIGLFAVTSLLLACTGLYGVLALLVAERTREFGIRIAVGATKRTVLAQVLGKGLLMAGIGILCGMAGSIALAIFLQGFLYRVSPWDPPTLLGGGLLVLVVTLTASVFPAHRATEADPVEALRR
jgi:predicted permease